MLRLVLLTSIVLGSFLTDTDPNVLQANPLIMLIPAILSAVAAAGTGIAGAAQSGQAAEDAKKNSAANRAQQMRIARMQIEAQKAQQAKDQQQSALMQLSNLKSQTGDQAQELGMRKIDANTGAMDSIAKAFIRRQG